MNTDSTNNAAGAPAPTREMTFGEKAVGLTFNPSNSGPVDAVKRSTAALIDQLNDYRSNTDHPERKRMLSLAITEIQAAQMWAVKAITWQH